MFEHSSCTDSCDACQGSLNNKTKTSQGLFLDKENIENMSPAKEELSLYGSTSPLPFCTGTSPNHCHNNIISRRPLEDHDLNSRDSGYIPNDDDGVRFSSYASPSRGSFDTIGSMEDDFFEEFSDFEPLDDDLPQNFNKLINGPLKQQQQQKSPKDLVIRPLFRRALSFQNDRSVVAKARACLFNGIPESRPFKRPDPPQDFESPNSSKKLKMETPSSVPSRPVLKFSFSATEESIMCAVQRSAEEPDLIGDFSKTFGLPLTPGRHQDLKSITSATLAALIKGDYRKQISSFKVIDCRYPYEFLGGHINGAINVYTKEQCLELLKGFETKTSPGRDILVFHCEFSSERGPNLYRYLREQDRQINQEMYPSLHYPEVYLLDGGYKNFFEQYSSMCVPTAYTEMLNPAHEEELRYFRLKSKTWNADMRQRSKPRPPLKRLL